MNPSHACSLKNSFSPEYITHYCISCRNQMQTLFHHRTNRFCRKMHKSWHFVFLWLQGFYFVMVIVLFSCFVWRQQFLRPCGPQIWTKCWERNDILLLLSGCWDKGVAKQFWARVRKLRTLYISLVVLFSFVFSRTFSWLPFLNTHSWLDPSSQENHLSWITQLVFVWISSLYNTGNHGALIK